MVTIGTLYVIRPDLIEVEVQPGRVPARNSEGVIELITSCYAPRNAVVYIEVLINRSFGILTGCPVIYYKPAGSSEASLVESLPAEIEAALSNIR
jgi:hypothetical protein